MRPTGAAGPAARPGAGRAKPGHDSANHPADGKGQRNGVGWSPRAHRFRSRAGPPARMQPAPTPTRCRTPDWNVGIGGRGSSQASSAILVMTRHDGFSLRGSGRASSPRQSRHVKCGLEEWSTRALPDRRRPLRLMRGLNQVRTRCPIPACQAASASGSRRCRGACAPAPSRAARGGAGPNPVCFDRTRGNVAGTEPAGLPRRE